MTDVFRCVVFAAVSSAPQAAADKDSIPTQIERARAMIARRGWEEVAEPLVVPGQTRSISWLHEAIESVSAIAGLINLAQERTIDLVVCRDYDRLARRSSLLAQIREYLRQRHVQIYALDKPVEPSPPGEMGRHNEGQTAAAMIEAISGVTAEEEVNRIVRRRSFGMNAVMRRGRYKMPERATPFGYSRVVTNDKGEEVRLDTAVPVPEQVALIKRIEDLYLDGYSYARIAELLNAERIPSPRDSMWMRPTIKGILKQEFYCGIVMWGYRRRQSVYDEESGSFVRKDRYVPVVQSFLDRTGYLPNVFELMEYPEECARDQLVIAEGEHEPIRTKKRQRRIYDEIARKRKMGGRAASTDGFCYLFSGLGKCGDCGYAMGASRNYYRDKRYIYYWCTGHRFGVPCENTKWAREERVYEHVMRFLMEIARYPEAADLHLSRQSADKRAELQAERETIREALRRLAAKRSRWDDAYESDVIDLETYGQRLGELNAQCELLARRLSTIETALQKSLAMERRRADIMELLSDIPDVEDRAATKVFLRRVLEELVFLDGDVQRIVLCDTS